jgi:hypothetical protein
MSCDAAASASHLRCGSDSGATNRRTAPFSSRRSAHCPTPRRAWRRMALARPTQRCRRGHQLDAAASAWRLPWGDANPGHIGRRARGTAVHFPSAGGKGCLLHGPPAHRVASLEQHAAGDARHCDRRRDRLGRVYPVPKTRKCIVSWGNVTAKMAISGVIRTVDERTDERCIIAALRSEGDFPRFS